MKKVIVERPRAGGGPTRRHNRDEQRVKNDLEAAPLKEPLRSKRERTKSFNEHLAPLRRYLLKNVGRPWNKVRSEVLRGLGGGRGALQNHVLTHLKQYVVENAIFVEGVPHIASYGGGLRPLASVYSSQALYACPKTGLLKIAEVPKQKKPERFEVRRLSEFKLAMHFRGCWYEVVTKYFTSVLAERDAYFERAISESEGRQMWGDYKGRAQRAVRLRPLRRGEIRMLPFDATIG